MIRGGKVACGVAVLAVAACSANQGTLSVRPIPTKLAEGARPVPFRVAEGRGQLALGNVALALESFRKALREDPESVDALLGVATCYDLMGRFDLSRRNYEAALAIAPADTQLLAALAGSLDRQGRRAEAASVRLEINERLAAAAASAKTSAPIEVVQAQAVPVTNVKRETSYVQQASGRSPAPAVQQVASVPPAASLPQAPAIRGSAPVAAALEARTAVARVPVDSPAPVAIAAQPVEVAQVHSSPLRLALPVILAEAPPAKPGPSVTIKLPPPRPAAPVVADVKPAIAPAAPAPAATAEPNESAAAPAAIARSYAHSSVLQDGKIDQTGPRLERLSRGEVALVTVSGPRWRSEPVSRSARSTTVRFVPVRQATEFAEVRLLNAARVHRLAARTRAWLAGRGWLDVSIGDAPATRRRSIILYPAGQRLVARRLSSQFGFAIAPRRDVGQVTVLLGRDSVRIAGARAKT